MALIRRRTLMVAAVGVAALALVAAAALRPSRDATPPERIWTTAPPQVAPTGPLAPADARTSPDGPRLRGWDAHWAARWGPKGGPQFVWSLFARESAGAVAAILDRFRGVDVEPRMATYESADATETRDGVTWHAWTRTSTFGGPSEGR